MPSVLVEKKTDKPTKRPINKGDLVKYEHDGDLIIVIVTSEPIVTQDDYEGRSFCGTVLHSNTSHWTGRLVPRGASTRFSTSLFNHIEDTITLKNS